MKVNLRSGRLLLCLYAVAAFLCGQEQPPAPPSAPAPAPQRPSAAPAAPKYTPSAVDNGNGLSLEPIYWLTKGKPRLRTGDDNTTGVPGDLDYPGTLDRAYGGKLIVPVSKNDSVQFTYFQTKMTGGSIAGQNLNLFGVAIAAGDPLASEVKISSYKLSYNFLTYYWNHPSGDLRLKTLWEVQYLNLDSTFDDFQPQSDGTFNLNPTSGTKSLITPTFGLGLDQTLGSHFRWEVKVSGFGLPHRAELGDGEADIALRYGRVEFVAGGRALYFRTSRRSDHFNSGTLYGPYVGLRLYWKKK